MRNRRSEQLRLNFRTYLQTRRATVNLLYVWREGERGQSACFLDNPRLGVSQKAARLTNCSARHGARLQKVGNESPCVRNAPLLGPSALLSLVAFTIIAGRREQVVPSTAPTFSNCFARVEKPQNSSLATKMSHQKSICTRSGQKFRFRAQKSLQVGPHLLCDHGYDLIGQPSPKTDVRWVHLLMPAPDPVRHAEHL